LESRIPLGPRTCRGCGVLTTLSILHQETWEPLRVWGPPAITVMNAMAPPPIPVMAAIGQRRTSAYGSGQQTHAGESVDRPATSDGLGNISGSLMQEDFNKYMAAYMKWQKGQDFHQPSQGSNATILAARGANPWSPASRVESVVIGQWNATVHPFPGRTRSRFASESQRRPRNTGLARQPVRLSTDKCQVPIRSA
jgi:hypothetical protein